MGYYFLIVNDCQLYNHYYFYCVIECGVWVVKKCTLIKSGEIVCSYQATPQKKKGCPFDFEVDELDKMINGKFATIPKGLAQDPEAFEKWLREAFV